MRMGSSRSVLENSMRTKQSGPWLWPRKGLVLTLALKTAAPGLIFKFLAFSRLQWMFSKLLVFVRYVH